MIPPPAKAHHRSVPNHNANPLIKLAGEPQTHTITCLIVFFLGILLATIPALPKTSILGFHNGLEGSALSR